MLGSRVNATSSNLGSRLPLLFHPSAPPARREKKKQRRISASDALQALQREERGTRARPLCQTLSCLVFGVIARHLVKLQPVLDLCQSLFLFGMFPALSPALLSERGSRGMSFATVCERGRVPKAGQIGASSWDIYDDSTATPFAQVSQQRDDHG